MHIEKRQNSRIVFLHFYNFFATAAGKNSEMKPRKLPKNQKRCLNLRVKPDI